MVRFSQLPPSVRVGEVFDVETSVENLGQSEMRGVALEDGALAQDSPSCHVGLVSGPTPQKVDLPGGQRTVFRTQLKAHQSGSCSFRVSVKGLDATDGRAVVVGPATSAAVPVTW